MKSYRVVEFGELLQVRTSEQPKPQGTEFERPDASRHAARRYDNRVERGIGDCNVSGMSRAEIDRFVKERVLINNTEK